MTNQNLWQIFTAQQEYAPPFRDRFGRFPFSLAGNNVLEPVVSQYLSKEGFKPRYPDSKRFAVCVSHDVDLLFKQKWAPKTLVAQQLRSLARGDLRRFMYNFQETKRHIDPLYDLENVLEIGARYGTKSTFNFLALSPEEEDFNYRLEEIQPQLERVKSQGGEIALHGGHQAYRNVLKVKKEKEYLEQQAGLVIKGYRNHYLRFETPLTWRVLKEAGFSYDSTFGHAGSIGFRNGMCYPFFPFDVAEDAYIELCEIPLMVMDESLFSYMKLDKETALSVCRQMVDQIEEVGGVFTLLWHNNYMQEERGEIYESILENLHERGAWFATSTELVEWWTSQGYMEEMKNMLEKMRIDTRQ